MIRIIPLPLQLVLALGLAQPASLIAAQPPQGQSRPFQAGAALADISPTNFPVRVNAMFTERTGTQTVDPLHTRALVLDDGTSRVAIAVVDTCMMSRDLIDLAKALAREKTGIAMDRMLVAATHTHSAPSAMGCLGSRQDTNYTAYLPHRIAEAIALANKNLAPARVGWTVVNDWEHTFCRRWIRRPDRMLTDPFGQKNVRAHMHPGYQSPDALGPSGPADPGLSLIAFQSTNGQPLALLANYSQHYYGSPLLSSDYYGRFAKHFTALTGATNASSPFVAIMSQGTSGDLMWMDYGAPQRDVGYDAYAAEMARVAFETWKKIQYRPWAPIVMRETQLSLSFRVPDSARLDWARPIIEGLQGKLPMSQPEIYALEALYLHERPTAELKLQALRVGDLGIAAIPNEVFGLTGLKIKAQSPLQPTFTMELANGAEGYIPPPEQHALGGYTTWPARTAGLEVQAEPRIVETVLSLLETVSGKPRRPLTDTHGPYAKTVLDAKPIAYWRLNEWSGQTAFDASPFDRHALFQDGVAFRLPGPDGNARADGWPTAPPVIPNPFSGPDINSAQHLAGGRVAAKLPSLGKRFTICFWFWNGLPDHARGVTGHLLSWTHAGSGGAETAAVLGIGGTNHNPGHLFLTPSPNSQPISGTTLLPLKSWRCAALTRQDSQFSLYLDGRLEAQARAETESGDQEILLWLGGAPGSPFPFEGKLDEVAVFDSAWTAAEIEALHHHSLIRARP